MSEEVIIEKRNREKGDIRKREKERKQWKREMRGDGK